jgi:hypothetical protein
MGWGFLSCAPLVAAAGLVVAGCSGSGAAADASPSDASRESCMALSDRWVSLVEAMPTACSSVDDCFAVGGASWENQCDDGSHFLPSLGVRADAYVGSEAAALEAEFRATCTFTGGCSGTWSCETELPPRDPVCELTGCATEWPSVGCGPELPDASLPDASLPDASLPDAAPPDAP